MQLSSELKTRTANAHETAETRSFVTRLLGGELDVSAYVALLVELRDVYTTLEEAEDQLAADERVRGLLDPSLRRAAAIRADLVALGVDPDQQGRCVATRDYCTAILADVAAVPAAVVGHHYTRILGDLSGGQLIAMRMRKEYGLRPDQLTMLAFAEPPKRIADRYRKELDTVPFTPDERAAIIAASERAFACNARMFDELGGVEAPVPA